MVTLTPGVARRPLRRQGRPFVGPARLNRKHPLARFVAFMYSPAQGFVDLSTGSSTSFRTDTVTFVGSPRGPAANFTGSAANDLEFGNGRYNLLGDITVLWGGTPTDFGTYRNIISKQGVASGTTNIPFEVFINVTSGQPNLIRANASNFNSFSSNSAATAGAYNTVGMSQKGGIEVTPVMVLNGAVTSVTAFLNGPTGAPTGNTDPVRLGVRVDSATVPKGTTNFVIVLTKALAAPQMLALLSDPFQLLEPVRTNWVGVVAGGTFKPGWAYGATKTIGGVF